MKRTFVIYSLGTGGAERVMSVMANYFADRGDEVSIVTLDDGSAPPFFELRAPVRWQPLGMGRASGSPFVRVWNAQRRLLALRRRIQANDPDVVVAFTDRINILVLIATIGMGTPVIVSERNDPTQHHAGAIFGVVRRITYRRAQSIVTQTNAVASYFRPPLRAKTSVIPNPAPPPPARPAVDSRNGAEMMAMGRLTEAKGFDLLLRAFATIAGQHSDWNLTIWGEGALRSSLERLREELGLAERVRLPGRTATPALEMQRADLFVLSSRYEGFPNVLVEAMACGTPVVSFNCPSGPADIIEDGVNGRLVPPQDVEALASAMSSLMSDEQERQRLGANAERVTETFSLERVMNMWERVMDVESRQIEGATACAE
jgi:glycosyltransferase involved in cell wall biosynthesis